MLLLDRAVGRTRDDLFLGVPPSASQLLRRCAIVSLELGESSRLVVRYDLVVFSHALLTLLSLLARIQELEYIRAHLVAHGTIARRRTTMGPPVHLDKTETESSVTV